MQPNQQAEQLKSIIETILSLIENAAKTRREGKEVVEVEKEKLIAITNNLRRVNSEPYETVTNNTLSQILANTEEIKKELRGAQETKAKTWSQIVAGGHAAMPKATATGTQNQRAATNRRGRELIVTIPDQVQRAEIGNKPTGAILDAIRTFEPKSATDNIVTVRRLPRDDYQVITATEAGKKSLDMTTDWLRAFAPSAKVKKPTYTVRAHYTRVKAINDRDQLQAIAEIVKANQRLHPSLAITRIAWTKRTIEQGKTYGSLILVTECIDTANQLITRGLVHEGEIKLCERFIKEARITQCVRCQGYGHIAKFCKANATCAHCAGEHPTRDCRKDEKDVTTHKCRLCGGNHRAWEEICRYKQREIERALLAAQTTPTLYEKNQEDTTQPQQSIAPTYPFSFHGKEDSEWQQVARGRRGRPNNLTIAARATGQTRLPLKRARQESPGPEEINESTAVNEALLPVASQSPVPQ
jgi:hypothetical protein